MIDYDATVVERLREAGAVLCAKLSMGALAQGGVWFGGSTRNPWSPESSSSGSSAGPGAATSAGLVAFAIGTETRGSIISPSSTCGVVGLRPTYGRVSRYGAMALSWTMDKIGPMCRSVEDCAIVFNAIYGSDGRDETVLNHIVGSRSGAFRNLEAQAAAEKAEAKRMKTLPRPTGTSTTSAIATPTARAASSGGAATACRGSGTASSRAISTSRRWTAS